MVITVIYATPAVAKRKPENNLGLCEIRTLDDKIITPFTLEDFAKIFGAI